LGTCETESALRDIGAVLECFSGVGDVIILTVWLTTGEATISGSVAGGTREGGRAAVGVE